MGYSREEMFESIRRESRLSIVTRMSSALVKSLLRFLNDRKKMHEQDEERVKILLYERKDTAKYGLLRNNSSKMQKK